MAAKNPATLFLNLAAGNAAVSLVFIVIYFFYESKGGDRGYLLLLAAGIAMVAAVGSVVAYFHFHRKITALIEGDLEDEELVHPADRARLQSKNDE